MICSARRKRIKPRRRRLVFFLRRRVGAPPQAAAGTGKGFGGHRRQVQAGGFKLPDSGQVGDYLLSKGELDKRRNITNNSRTNSKSDYVDFAYAGLGEVAFEKKDYKTALVYFGDGTDKIAANIKLKDVTVARRRHC